MVLEAHAFKNFDGQQGDNSSVAALYSYYSL